MLQTLRAWLPVGIALSPADWGRRHRAITLLAWAHAVLLPLYGLAQDHSVRHVLVESALVAVLAGGAGARALSTTVRSLLATLALVSASALLVHFSGGLIEMHFHFFVVVAVISLYQSWIPFLTALGFVVAHHGAAGQLDPAAVYNHQSAVDNAWLWALVHGVFILAESAACLVAWRLNEIALEGERRARDDMASALRELANAQALAGVGSWEWDLDTGRVTWSDELYSLMGRRRGEFVPALESFLAHVVEADKDRIAELVEQAVAGDGAIDFECGITRADGVVRIIHGLGERSPSGDGTARMIGTCQDITERTTLQREIEHRTFHDSLTDLPNRAMFLDRLEHALAVSGRTGSRISLLYLDLDDFKAVNDNLGHSVGDEVLVGLSHRLRTLVRDSDTLARLGGDEFVLLLEGTTADAAAMVAEKVLQHLHEPLELPSGRRVARVSIGIAVAEDGDQPGDLLRRADIAMYAAKRQGAHGYRVFSDGMHSSLTARMELESELAEAISQDQLLVHYQPLVDLDTDAVDGVEALVRWDHPVRGMLPPSEFIPVAEEAGLMSVLGEWVLRRAANDVQELRRSLHSDLYLSVNVAPSQLDADLLDTVDGVLRETGLQPGNLLLELTESALIGEDAIQTLAALRARGVRIAIDDFGTGYSSLSYLKDLPVDILKIDRSFVRDIADSADASALTLSIIHLAQIFGLRIIGEGVETAEQAAALHALGCHVGQGYHYARPTDVGSLVEALRRIPAPRESTGSASAGADPAAVPL